jgi:MFS family permease
VETKPKKHHIKARIATLVFYIVCSLIGLVVSDIAREGAWNYWRVMAPVFGLAGLGLTFYLRRVRSESMVKTIWHEVVQWLGLMAMVFMLSIYVSSGIMGRFEAGLFVLSLLAFNLFILGVYVEITFLFIGIILALLSLGAGIFAAYLYTVIIPLSILVLIIFFIYLKKRKARH